MFKFDLEFRFRHDDVMATKTKDWADETEEDLLPARTESAPDENGIITITEWVVEKGEKIKRVTRVKRTTKKIQVNKNVAERGHCVV